VQVTAAALTGGFGDRVRQFAIQLLRDDLVHVVSSDAHDHERRPPAITGAVEAVERAVPGVSRRSAWLTEEVPAAILAGGPLPPPPPLPAARGGAWRRLTGAARR
jgi:protein-tyrosine phosphatase